MLIDEVQYIPEVGFTLKILIGSFKHLQIIAAGSASLGIAGKSSEPLVGRRININFYPLSIYELRKSYYSSDFDLKQELDDILF